MTRKKKCTLEITEIIQMYEEGEKTAEIARRANVSTRYINSVLQKNKVARTPHGSWKRKYRVNEDFFKTWSNNMAYILGFFAADGHISSRNHTVCFSQKDPDILEKIRNELQSNHPLVLNNTDVHTLIIGSKVMKYDLIDLHGMTSDKSTSLRMPKIPDEYFSHFVRGYFDGDGFVNFEKRIVSFVGGSESFMSKLNLELQRRNFNSRLYADKKYFRIFITGRKTIHLFKKWLYQDMELYLKRKYEVFDKETIQDANKIPESRIKMTKAAVKNRKESFLRLYKKSMTIDEICKEIKITPATFKSWLKKDREFKEEFYSIITTK
ncbi:helix-turn-helix domain-containing protein [Rossellomorea vietnamensis]|uniref:Endonuclease n=1 Tax=Rossellomorea vietnamensis TaxID=218284 RepID=A0A0P6W3M1_9BACI|nr:LAGLIDADG family homing endonuclease [Rossellomorea vietnamensis]KPL60054.1 endonuclease [Rossellomorea vietnamensis]